jgi:hypothetical protein
MPARLIAMTNGDEAAVPESSLRPSSFDGTSNPMIRVPTPRTFNTANLLSCDYLRTPNIEQKDTDVYSSDSFRQVAPGVLRFASSDLRLTNSVKIGTRRIAIYTATISVPINEKAACVITAHQPRN